MNAARIRSNNSSIEPRPLTERKFICRACGEDLPEGTTYRRRPHIACPKCRCMTWEEIPPRGRELERIIQ
jgi:hypothetical protein